MAGHYRPGEVVVFMRQKYSQSPGPRARDVSPAETGESYTYVVDKYWLVAGMLDDGQLRVLTRTGKEHLINADDNRLRRPSLWERLFMRKKFPSTDLLSESRTTPSKTSSATDQKAS